MSLSLFTPTMYFPRRCHGRRTERPRRVVGAYVRHFGNDVVGSVCESFAEGCVEGFRESRWGGGEMQRRKSRGGFYTHAIQAVKVSPHLTLGELGI